jgi:DNA-directed DNA polymerase III PolC
MIVKSDYSLFHSTLTMNKLVKNVKDLGFQKIILADNNLSGALTFYYAAKKEGLMPILGVTGIFSGVEYLFIAHNSKGYSILSKMESKGYEESIFCNEDITSIAIDIKSTSFRILSRFSALKNEVLKVDKLINRELSKDCIILPIKIGNIISTEDFYTIAAMNAIENKSQYEKEVASGNIVYSEISKKEDLSKSKEFLEIISKCIDDYKFGDPTPPTFKFTKEVSFSFGLSTDTDKDLFEFLCWEGLKNRVSVDSINNIPKEYSERMSFELNVINEMNFPGYFLIVWDFINEARKRRIPVGPGRGSAAGSLVAYSLEITDLDPLKYNLLFERFLNPERVNLPDIDMDFCRDRREEVIDYVISKYGKDNVSQVITFGKLAAKAAIRDAARVIGAPLYLSDKMAKMISDKPGITLSKSYSEGKQAWDKMFEEDFIAKKIWDMALRIEGLKKNQGVHAAGLVISNTPIYNRAPLYHVNDTQVVAFEGGFLEDVDLVKYDFLGLKTLTVIDNAVYNINKDKNMNINMRTLEFNDPEIFKLISSGLTLGLFQIESPGMQNLARRLQPSNFEEIIAMLALYRPGPMEAGMLDSFIDRKHGREKVDYFFDSMSHDLEPILKPTYGLIVYQEQVMQIVQAIAGFNLGEADMVRRAMGKKKPEEMERISKEFVLGAVKNGHNAEEAKKLFDLIEKFAGYGFNKSHSAAYAALTYQTAWLKKYFPAYFMTHLINSEITNTDKFVPYINELKKLNISLSSPDIRTSTNEFSVKSDNSIVFGLKAIKGVGSGAKNILRVINSLNKESSIFDLLVLTQRNITKDISTQETLIRKLERTYLKNKKIYEDAFFRVQNLNQKLKEKNILTKRDSDSLTKYSSILDSFQNGPTTLDNYFNEVELAKEKLLKLKQELEDKDSFNKIDKRVFEALSEVGAFQSFNVTRKDLLENVTNLLNIENHSKVNFTNEEYSISDLIKFEEERTGLIISELFSKDQVEYLNSLDIPSENPIGILIDKKEKRKKDSSIYTNIKIMLSNGDIISASDFNNKSKNFQLGEMYSFMLKMNGPYINLLQIKKATKKLISSYPKKELTKKITVLDNIDNIDINKYSNIEVYDLDGSIIAVYSKKI